MTAHMLRGPLHNVGFCPLLLALDMLDLLTTANGTTRKKTAVVMTSALLRSADVARETAYFAIVPIGDIASLLDHFVGAREKRCRHFDA